MRTLAYEVDQIVVLEGAPTLQLMVEFNADERIENVAIGNALAWQVTPNRRANILFLKPVDLSSTTNMTVVTSQRRYLFELHAAPTPRDAPYVVRFRYPATEAAAGPAEPRVENEAYRVSGSAAVRPIRVFDDGRFTYFEWSRDTPLPALFANDAHGGEGLVNARMRGRFLVVEQLSPGFVLRHGDQVARVENRAPARRDEAAMAR